MSPSRAVSLSQGADAASHAREPLKHAREAAPAGPVFGEWLSLRVLSVDGPHASGLPLSCTEQVTRALRGALLRHATDPPPPVLSGHTPDGRRLERPHVAFVALPVLGACRAGARVGGVAIALPREVDPEERQAVLLAAARWERSGLRLVLGRLGALRLARADAAAAGDPLEPASWLGPARHWATLTPIALERNPGKLSAADPAAAARTARHAEETVARGCAHICLPRPVRVRVLRRPFFSGVPSAAEFGPFPRGTSRPGSGKFQRVCVHAEIEFAEPVAGPVLLGAGRYFGVGLCKPR